MPARYSLAWVLPYCHNPGALLCSPLAPGYRVDHVACLATHPYCVCLPYDFPSRQLQSAGGVVKAALKQHRRYQVLTGQYFAEQASRLRLEFPAMAFCSYFSLTEETAPPPPTHLHTHTPRYLDYLHCTTILCTPVSIHSLAIMAANIPLPLQHNLLLAFVQTA